MKKILFVFTVLSIFSCSSSDDNSNEKSNTDFHPPEWIIGNWKQNSGVTFSFTKNDLCFTNISGDSQCQQGIIDIMRQGGTTVKVTEVASNTFYSAEVKYSNGQSTTYAFKKISNSIIEWTSATGVELIKQ